MSAPEWTFSSGLTGKGVKLAGCHIFLNTSNYTLTKPNQAEVLATSSGTSLPLTFPNFNYKDIDTWSVGLSTAVDSGNATGSWSFPNQPGAQDPDGVPVSAESGTYTAQTGPGQFEEEASSASA